MDIKGLLVNSQNKQSLFNHSIAVGKVSYELSKKLTSDSLLQEKCLLAGLLHDIGKVNNKFQEYIRGDEEYEDVIRHHLYNYVLLSMTNVDELISELVLYHHVVDTEEANKISNI